jgi:hypothetical protein
MEVLYMTDKITYIDEVSNLFKIYENLDDKTRKEMSNALDHGVIDKCYNVSKKIIVKRTSTSNLD